MSRFLSKREINVAMKDRAEHVVRDGKTSTYYGYGVTKLLLEQITSRDQKIRELQAKLDQKFAIEISSQGDHSQIYYHTPACIAKLGNVYPERDKTFTAQDIYSTANKGNKTLLKAVGWLLVNGGD